jgi:hypothetical protein
MEGELKELGILEEGVEFVPIQAKAEMTYSYKVLAEDRFKVR